MKKYNPFNYNAAELRKAIFGALGAVALGLATVLSDGVITEAEGWFVVAEGLAAFGIVFAVPNKDTTPERDTNLHNV